MSHSDDLPLVALGPDVRPRAEPSVPIERIRQPLTAILGRLDLIGRSFLTEDVEADVLAAKHAALLLKKLCDDAERESR